MKTLYQFLNGVFLLVVTEILGDGYCDLSNRVTAL